MLGKAHTTVARRSSSEFTLSMALAELIELLLKGEAEVGEDVFLSLALHLGRLGDCGLQPLQYLPPAQMKGRSTSGWESSRGKPPEERRCQPPGSREIHASKRGGAKLRAATRVNPGASKLESVTGQAVPTGPGSWTFAAGVTASNSWRFTYGW